jgi:GT2 family glycosyltransferase
MSRPGHESDWPLITVAIVAYNRREALSVTLRTLRERLDYPSDRLELIVVDNASEDGTPAMLAGEFPHVRCIALDRNIGAPAWNSAFAAGRGDFFLILDDDCYIEGDALRRAVRGAQEEHADLVSFQVRSSVDPGFYFTSHYVTGLLSFWGCAWLISRRGLDAVGGYDPRIFIWANELDLTLRLLDAGLRHLYLPEIVAVHMKAPPTSPFVERSHVTNNANLAYVATKLLRPSDAVRVIARLVLLALLDAVVLSPKSFTRTLPQIFAGVRRGLPVRKPVRREVSAAARDNFGSFANPALFLRGPLERVVPSRQGPSPDERWQRFRARRSRFFPPGRAVLRL